MDITRDSIHNLGIVVWYFKARKIEEVVNKFETVKKQKKVSGEKLVRREILRKNVKTGECGGASQFSR